MPIPINLKSDKTLCKKMLTTEITKKLKKLTCRELNTSLMRYVKYVIWMLQRMCVGKLCMVQDAFKIQSIKLGLQYELMRIFENVK